LGVIHQGGPYKAVVDGLRDGLRQSGMEEGKHFVLDIRDAKGDLKAVEEAARNFEREKANLIYAVTTSVATVVKNCYLEEPNCFRRRQRPGSPADWCRALGNLEEDLRAFSIRPRISRGSGWKF
jgi:ABC transporter substrate binding protein